MAAGWTNGAAWIVVMAGWAAWIKAISLTDVTVQDPSGFWMGGCYWAVL